MDTTSETIPVQGQESNAPTPTKGWSEWFTDKVSSVTSSVTGSSDTKASLEAEKAELNTKDRQITIKIAAIDEKIRTLPAAPPPSVAPLDDLTALFKLYCICNCSAVTDSLEGSVIGT